MASKPVLYSYYRSSCSWRVRIALAWKGIDYEYRPVNLLTGEQFSPEFTEINPLNEVPVFVENGNVITQSVPIVEYLEEAYPAKPLLPSDIVQKAKVRSVVEIVGSGIQPLQNLAVLLSVGENKLDWAQRYIERGFKALEKRLQPLHGKCCIGDNVTLADVYLAPQVYNAKRYEVDMSKFPLLAKINDHLLSYDAFKLSHPDLQPDCPAK